MKHILLTIAAIATLSVAALAAEPEYVFTDAATLPLYGKITPDTYLHYTRLPASLENVTRQPVWNLGKDSAGEYIRFRSDAPSFKFKWTNLKNYRLDNMSDICARGLSLYVYDKGEWVYVEAARPRSKDGNNQHTVNVRKLKGEMREYMLYLSLYDGIRELQIGVPARYGIEAPVLNSPRAERPAIFYGTSILQGASASHPGMAGTNQMSRKLDRQVINLGFSGNAKIDYEIAEYMASYPDPSMYVLDNMPNGSPELTREKMANFYRILRDAHPVTPIIFVEGPIYPGCRFDTAREKFCVDKNIALKEVFDSLKTMGEKHIYYVKSDKMLTSDNIGTIEGTHFTDIGFGKWVDCLYPTLRKFNK